MQRSVCQECVISHSQKGENYSWLNVLGHGNLVNVWYEEPVDSRNWKIYTPKVWQTHCRVIDHGDNLYEDHLRAFVNPETRFAKLLFLFEDNTLMEPTSEFYILEQIYFDNNKYCKRH